MTWTFHNHDVQRTPWPIEDESVQCVVTSPPYWGLRDYGTATWEGGSAECNHVDPKSRANAARTGSVEKADENRTEARTKQFTVECGRCGALRVDAQLGLERTPAEYVEKMVAVFREVRRVLRKDGTVWLNLGDCFSNKQLVGIPWRGAFALQADGWWLRSDIVWAKPNPMPESILDRPTRSHEFIFLLTKSSRYFYDQQAIRQPLADASVYRMAQPTFDEHTGGPKDSLDGNRSCRKTLENMRHNLARKTSQESANRIFTDPAAMARIKAQGANARTVWSIASEPYPEAHFATFPTELARRCILAGSKPGDTILDTFSGSGTVALVADMLGRNSIGLELNPAYIALAEKRVRAPRTEGEKDRVALEDAGQTSIFDQQVEP